MDILIAAINHNDVLGRERLKKWLQKVSKARHSPPEFIGVEWDEGIFNQVKAQRSLIRDRAKSEWPGATPGFLDKIESSLGFEGDTHNDIFPDILTLWLDQGRKYDDRCICNYAVDRMDMYTGFIPDASADFGHKILMRMSIKAWKRSSPQPASERDRRFAELIVKRSVQSKSGSAIAIVGEDHASLHNGFMANLLEKRGLSCCITILSPKSTQKRL